jgi:hypothetical protein
MMTTLLRRKSTRRRRINRAVKNLKKEEEGNDYSKPIIKYGSAFDLGHRNRTFSRFSTIIQRRLHCLKSTNHFFRIAWRSNYL